MLRVLYTGNFARQLDLPSEILEGDGEKAEPREAKRSSAGALHLSPRRVHVMTQDEFDLAVAKDPTLKRDLRQLGEIPEPSKKTLRAKTMPEKAKKDPKKDKKDPKTSSDS